MSEELQCYNKACGAKYKESENKEDSCRHHPGVPVFHDALKGWSCCKKRTTDFTDFLKIPGCQLGYHSNEKVAEDLKPQVKTSKENNGVTAAPPITLPPPKPITNDDDAERPSASEPLETLAVKVTSSYDKAKATKRDEEKDDGQVKIGTKCRNPGCEEAFANAPSDKTICLHHPGTAVFHEGMKYWSCCKRKTSDFQSFLNQAGCTKGSHVWKKAVESKVVCRYDHHQTSKNVIVSIFAKHCNVDTSTFEANQVYLRVSIDYEGSKHFNLNIHLTGVIDPRCSHVTVSGTKIELSLRKSRAMTWKTLGKVEEDKEAEEKIEKVEEIVESSEDSDLDGIDDVIFD